MRGKLADVQWHHFGRRFSPARVFSRFRSMSINTDWTAGRLRVNWRIFFFRHLFYRWSSRFSERVRVGGILRIFSFWGTSRVTRGAARRRSSKSTWKSPRRARGRSRLFRVWWWCNPISLNFKLKWNIEFVKSTWLVIKPCTKSPLGFIRSHLGVKM